MYVWLKKIRSQPSISNCLYFLLFFTLITFMHQMEQNGPLLGGLKNIFRLSKSKERTRTYRAYFWMLCNMARRLALHFIELSSTESTI